MIILKDWNIIVNFCTMFLSNTFSDPNNIATLLLFEFQVTVENSKMKLLKKSVNIQTNLLNHSCLLSTITQIQFHVLIINNYFSLLPHIQRICPLEFCLQGYFQHLQIKHYIPVNKHTDIFSYEIIDICSKN